jgi:exopolyphosphatase/guanosine-5'-triphosphate,3'-diphosphate pyrophosphatase
MARGLEKTLRLSEKAVANGLRTLELFARFSRANGLTNREIEVVATSAIRDAENSEALLLPAEEATGFNIRVLTAAEEAHYGFLAAVNSTDLDTGAVLDIGGGSMQLVAVRDRIAQRYGSWPLGAVRVTERLLSGGDKVSAKKLKEVREEILRELDGAGWLQGGGGRLVGIGGAVRNLATAAQRASDDGAAGIQGFMITPKDLDNLVLSLAERSVSERREIRGIKAERADVILAAAVVVQVVLEYGNYAGIEVTEAGLRDGVFFETHLLKDFEQPLLPNVRRASVLNCLCQYESDRTHVEHVTELADQLYLSLINVGLIKGDHVERELLWAAAMLHDIGTTINYNDHHKHSRYLILKSSLPGFNPRELALIAQIARYHRKGMPNLDEVRSVTEASDVETLKRCAIVLRLAEHLDRGHDRSINRVWLAQKDDAIELHLSSSGDTNLARWSIERSRDFDSFRRIFGRELLLEHDALPTPRT